MDVVPEERVSKKQRTQDTIYDLTQLVKTVLDGLAGMNNTLNQSNEGQRRLQNEVNQLAQRIGTDAVQAKFFLTNMTQYSNTLSNMLWQLAGGRSAS